MVGTDHQAAGHSGNYISGHHSLASLHVDEDEMMARARIAAAGKHGRHQAVGRRLDGDPHDLVRRDGGDSRLRVILVCLDAIGKADCDKGCRAPILAKFPRGALGQ